MEDQLAEWEPNGNQRSPDQLDAMVWGLTELMMALRRSRGAGWLSTTWRGSQSFGTRTLGISSMISQFKPTSSTTVTPVPPLPQTFAMPSGDANNYYDTLLTWTGGGPCYISFGAGAPVGPNVAGNVVVQSGQTLLLTTNAATLAASTPNQNLQKGAQAAAAPNATSFTVLVTTGGGSLAVTRGSSLPIVNF